jgi:hypothetical protein
MEINVNVEGVEALDLTTVIAQRVRYDEDGERDVTTDITLGERVAVLVAAKLTKEEEWGGLRKRYLDIRSEVIREQVAPIVTEAISGPIQKTNHYGEPTSGTTTLRELIMAEVSTVINQKADRHSSSGQTMLQRNISQAVKTILEKELSEVFAAEKAKVVAAVRAKAADLIADAVKQGIGR